MTFWPLVCHMVYSVSEVRTPVLEETMGPIVLPQGQSLRTTNPWTSTFATSTISRQKNPVSAFVA